MKKRTLALALALLLTMALFTSCSAVSGATGVNSQSSDAAAIAEEYGYKAADMAAAAESPAEVPEPARGETGVTDYSVTDLEDKIIYSMDAQIETMDFEASVEKVAELIERFGGFVESSSQSGVDYYSRQNNRTVSRYAQYTLRIPSDNYGGMTDSLSEIGNVVSRSSYAENITAQFYDSQSRLSAYRTEEERLLSMLEQVEDVESMIVIEQRLSEVRYNIEALETQLLNWQRQVDYSTVNLYIEEVAELTSETPVVRTYWEQVGDDLSDTISGLGRFFKNLLRAFIAALPVIIIVVIIALVVILIIRKKRAARLERLRQKQIEQNKTDEENNGK